MRDILQVIKGWYSATIYITPKKGVKNSISQLTSGRDLFLNLYNNDDVTRLHPSVIL